jgi:hypothetical protein
MAKTFFEDGRHEELRQSILRLGTKRFGPPTAEIQTYIRSVDELNRLQELLDRVIDAKSWDELLEVAKA